MALLSVKRGNGVWARWKLRVCSVDWASEPGESQASGTHAGYLGMAHNTMGLWGPRPFSWRPSRAGTAQLPRSPLWTVACFTPHSGHSGCQGDI